MPSEATVITKARQLLDSAAREHKRSEQYHRRRAQELRRSLENLEADCVAAGIRLHIHETKPNQEAQSDDGTSSTT